MNNNTYHSQEFKNVFQNSLRLNARTMSVRTLLSERNLKRIDYSPYYQRNYVWDNAKQTFFIESVILGTEIPPIILFKSGAKIEVIDGRQRFETLKRFKENDITLKTNGLKELQVLNKQSFNKLAYIIQEGFLESNIRIFEFEILNQPDLDIATIDRIKKEIFRRYNTGITPLNREELDNAKYDDDEFSDLFKAELKNDYRFLKKFNNCFFPKDKVNDEGNNDGLITKNVDFIRRHRILNSFPIANYASGKRTEIIELLYDFANNDTEDNKKVFFDFKETINEVLDIYFDLSKNNILKNKFIYECLFWALIILKQEQVEVSYNQDIFIKHYVDNIENYSEDSSHYSKSIITRFSDTAEFFKKLTNFDFSNYIRSDKFKSKYSKLRQTEIDAAKSIDELSNLRLNKPNPISTPIDEIKNDLKTTRYLLRPSYQRQEKISMLKAASIIESILLGINLPPIFVYRRKNNVKEIVDGQQRLLAIIGFLGAQYYNEGGKLSYSKNNNFKLKGLRILTQFEGYNYNSLPLEMQDKILDFDVDLIIIEEGVNEFFDPIDLFIRLNYKPYPIKSNSFEMWNSIVNNSVIRKIKKVKTHENITNWFFLREIGEGKPDRMLNEELITILSYINYINQYGNFEDVIGFFPRQDRITCRLKNKKALSEFLINDIEVNENYKVAFLEAIDNTSKLICKFGALFNSAPTKELLNTFLNVKNSKTFRRSLQDFYVIWLIIDKISNQSFQYDKESVLMDIRNLLSILRNSNNVEVNKKYFNTFNRKLDELSKKYNSL